LELEPILAIAILGFIILMLLFIGSPIKPIRLISQGVVKLIIGALFLFFLNIIGNQFGIHVPINLITSAVSGILGIPGVMALVAIEMWII
jgi:inhibitor of the pro-sigma K processing machinery